MTVLLRPLKVPDSGKNFFGEGLQEFQLLASISGIGQPGAIPHNTSDANPGPRWARRVERISSAPTGPTWRWGRSRASDLSSQAVFDFWEKLISFSSRFRQKLMQEEELITAH